MVAISTLLNFIQEARSTKAADALKAMVSNTATVLRVINDKGENGWLEIPIDQLVPGDIIKLAAGDMIQQLPYLAGAGICSSLRRR